MRRLLASLGRVGLVLTLALGIASASSSTAAATLHSPNWSGYVAIACGTCMLRYVAATWILPAVNCAKSPPIAWDDSWVGLDGWTSGSVEQIGTSGICTNGQPSYIAWYQMYPDNAVWSFGTIRPGDLISASVYYNATTHRWQLTLDDHATGTAIHTSQPCPHVIQCGNADAEVITEAPNAGANVPLADFGSTAYSSIRVTSRNGTHGDMASNRLWSVWPIDLVGSTGDLLAAPGPTTGAAFTETWHAAQ